VPKPLDPCPEIHCKQDMVAYRPWEWPQASESDGLPSPALVECRNRPEILNISSSEAMRPRPSCHARSTISPSSWIDIREGPPPSWLRPQPFSWTLSWVLLGKPICIYIYILLVFSIS
jgi:hypothetical protein